MKKLCVSLMVMFGLAGCDASADAAASGDTDVFGDDMPDDLPAGNCGEDTSDEDCETDGDSAGSADSTTGAVDSDCLVDGCMGQGVCAADWDMDDESRGEFECRFACIPLLDDSSWCGDDDSCCDAGARCTERGYCVLDDEVDSDTDGTTTGGSDTDGDTDTDTDTDGSTDTDTDGGSGTETGGAP